MIVRRFLLLTAFPVALIGCEGSTGNAANEGQQSIAQRLEQKCLSEFPALIEQSDVLIEQGKADEAAQHLRPCSGPLLGKSAEYAQALQRVDGAKLKQKVEETPKENWRERLGHLEEWNRLVTTLPAPFDKELVALTARKDASEKRVRRYKEQAEAMKYYPFCAEVGRIVRAKGPPGERGEAIMEVAKGRYGLRHEDDGLILRKELAIGMPFCAVVASLGTPSEVREIATRHSKGWSVWYRDRQMLIHLDEDQTVTSYSR